MRKIDYTKFIRIVFVGIVAFMGMVSYAQTQLQARDDRISAISGIALIIPIRINDSIPANCTEPIFEIVNSGHAATIDFIGDSIYYISAAGYVGFDTLTYNLICGTDTSIANVYIYVAEKPENISNAYCYIEPPAAAWTISEIQNVNQLNIFSYQTPMVGDIDGDGIPEIVTVNVNRNGIVIFKGNNLSTYTTFSTGTLPAQGSCVGLIRTKISNTESKTLIVVCQENGYMVAYNINGSQAWATSTAIYSPVAIFGFADFNKDGYAEIYVGNKILNAATGTILFSGSQNAGLGKLYNHDTHATAVGDFLQNGNLQLAAGNQIYEINNTLTGMSVVKTLPTFKMEDNVTDAPLDGITALLDLDLDGNLDILVLKTTGINYGTLHLYVWSPALNQVIAKKSISNAAISGIPLIGDIDGDGYPEIVFITGTRTGNIDDNTNFIHALKYIPGNKIFSILWQLRHGDSSGCTGLTLFDFNQDNISELVYRDEKVLRIINGSMKSHLTGKDTTLPYNLTSIICASGTYTEMPVIADIDNDGHAEIITIGPAISSATLISYGPLRVFKGAVTSPWAPARKVWNQTYYNSVNVNEDLTLPQYSVNPATVFSGKDGILGTSDDIRPYNNFLQQQTILNRDGYPLWLAPNVEIVGTPTSFYHDDGDSLIITVTITNSGEAAMQAPLYISAYQNVADPANFITVDSAMTVINVGDTISVIIIIRNFSTYTTLSNVIIRINDRGTVSYVQAECEYGNNTRSAAVNKLLSQKYIGCPGAVVSMGFNATNGITYDWYDDETGGNLIKSSSDTIMRIKENNLVQTFWAEPVYNSIHFPRLKVELLLGDCGIITPTGCAAEGTILFKEDFGGNDPEDPHVKSEGITQVENYVYSDSLRGYGTYTIAKSSASFYHSSWYKDIDDHTYPNDTSRGYMAGFDGSQAPGQFYSGQIDGLCAGTNLYFSLWISNIQRLTSPKDNPRQIFIVEDLNGDVLAEYYTNVYNDADPRWKQYGFNFTVPDNTSSIKLRIINNGTGSDGNDFAFDDIEVRICIPPVTLSQATNKDTMLCEGSSLTFEGSYTDVGNTFGAELVYRWEKNTGDINDPAAWHEITGTADNSNNGNVTSSYTIDSVVLSDVGYYRLAVANEANIDNYNCRSMSDIIRLQVVKPVVAGTVSGNDTVCYGETPNQLTTTSATGGSGTYTYQWEQSVDNGANWTDVIGGIGSTLQDYTPPALTQTTKYHLRVTAGALACDTAYSNEVEIMVHSLPTFVAVADTTICTAVNLNGLIGSVSVNAVIRFYSDAQGNNLLLSPLVWILSDTLYSVRAVDTVTDCMSAIQTINIHEGTYPAESPITGKNIVCIDETITLSNAAIEGGTWSISNPSIAEIVSQTANSVDIKGKTAGVVYVSYTIGNVSNCQTRVTFQLKVIPSTIPEIIIGIER